MWYKSMVLSRKTKCIALANHRYPERDLPPRPGSGTSHQLRTRFLDLETFTNDDPLSDSECKAHGVCVFLSESLINKAIDLLPRYEAKLFHSVSGEQAGEQLLQRTVLWIRRRGGIWLPWSV